MDRNLIFPTDILNQSIIWYGTYTRQTWTSSKLHSTSSWISHQNVWTQLYWENWDQEIQPPVCSSLITESPPPGEARRSDLRAHSQIQANLEQAGTKSN